MSSFSQSICSNYLLNYIAKRQCFSFLHLFLLKNKPFTRVNNSSLKVRSRLAKSDVPLSANSFFLINKNQNSSISHHLTSKLTTSSDILRSPILINSHFKVKHFEIADVSREEGIDCILDLNLEGDLKKYGCIFDFGTVELVFDSKVYFTNIFQRLRSGGIYLLSLPANGWI